MKGFFEIKTTVPKLDNHVWAIYMNRNRKRFFTARIITSVVQGMRPFLHDMSSIR